MIRSFVVGSALALLCVQAFGQTATGQTVSGQSIVQSTPGASVQPPATRPDSPNPVPTSGAVPGLNIERPWPTWQAPLRRDAQQVLLTLTPGATARTLGSPEHCSIPLIEMPLPEHFDDAMVQKMGPHPDDKIAIAPPPDCPLRSALANPAKRK